MRRLASLLATLAVVAGCSPGTGGGHAVSPKPGLSAGPRLQTGSISGAAYRIQVPAVWNRTLLLWNHGYVAPGQRNQAQNAPGADLEEWLLQHGYALAGSSYASTGWAVQEALTDQLALLDRFERDVGRPQRTIAWGHSLGGIITAGLVQTHPERLAGGLAMCGVLAGSVASWNVALDAAFAFKTLLAPGSALQLTQIADGAANVQQAVQAFGAAAGTPVGRTRLSLVAALADTPGWFNPGAPEPAVGDYAGRLQNQLLWLEELTMPYAFNYRRELEQRAGGNPSWNLGVDYSALLQKSANRDEVVALYRMAGLDLDADLAALARAPRITPDPGAVAYLARAIVFDGNLQIPVLTVHTIGDGLVTPENESAFGVSVAVSGRLAELRQAFVHRAGHCAFTPAETLAALNQLELRLDRGAWDDARLEPVALNSAAATFGGRLNQFPFAFSAGAAAFVTYQPSPFLRPYDSRSRPPG